MAKRSAVMLDEEPAHKKQRPVWVNFYLRELAVTEQSLMILKEDPAELITAKLANHLDYMLAHINALIEYKALTGSEWHTLYSAILHLSTVGNMLADNVIKNPNLGMSQYLLALQDEVTNRIYPIVLKHCEESDRVEAEHELSAVLALPIPNLQENSNLDNPFDGSDDDLESDGIIHNDYRDLILSKAHKNKISKLGNKGLPGFLKAQYQKLYDEGLRTPDEVTDLISHPSSTPSLQNFLHSKTALMNCRYKFTLDKIIDLCKCSGSSKNTDVILTHTDQFIDYCKLSDEDIVKLGTKSGAYRVLMILADKQHFDTLSDFGFTTELITSTFHYERSLIVLQLTLWCITDGTFKEKKMTPTEISKIFVRKRLKFSDLLNEAGKTQEQFDDWVEKQEWRRASTHPQASQVQDEQLEDIQVEEPQWLGSPEKDLQVEDLQISDLPDHALSLEHAILTSYSDSRSNSPANLPPTGVKYKLGEDEDIALDEKDMKDFINSIPTMKPGIKLSS